MKKIGILTFQYPENRNFGAILQTYAHLALIKKINKYVEIIDYIPNDYKNMSLKIKLLTKLESKWFKEFSDKFLKISNFESLENEDKKCDIFIVGSDQVWRTKWLQEKVKHYFFDFVDENKKKIAYAASFGVDFWEGDKKLTEEIKPLIKRFDAISVREESGVNICKDIFGIDNAVCVLDPTLMISKEDYQPILDDWKDKSHLKEKYIAHMLLDDDEKLRRESQNIANYLKADINYIKGRYKKIFWKSYFAYNKVSQWLTYLKDAELVITDSFHCTVFSLIFHKKFIVVANPKRGIARLETLLGKVGLQDRLFTDIKDVMKSGILDKEIDYTEVDKKLEVHRRYSMEFLKKALED